MLTNILRLLGFRALRSAVVGGRRPPLDVKLGFALFRDRRVPVARKALALLLGAAIVGVLIAAQAPVEAMIALLLNLPGLGLDVMLDGMEMIVGPALFGAIFLTRLAPPEVVSRARIERYRVIPLRVSAR